MSIKNSIKLLLNNFSVVWKILLYKLVIFFISLALIVGFVLPNVLTIINSIGDTGLFENLKNLVNDFIARVDLNVNLEAFKTSLENASKVLTENAQRLMMSYIYIMIIVVLTNLLSGLSELAGSDVINADMSANAKYSFSSRFIITFGKNIKYQLVRLFTEIPVYIIIAFIVWNVFSFLFSYIAVFSVFFAFIVYIVLTGFTQSFFCGWLPEITLNKTNVFDAIRISFKKIRPHFFQILSGFVLINITLFFINSMLAFFTCGAGLLISIPMSTLLVIIYRLVIYYDINGLKYYADNNTIVSPQSLN